MRTSEQAKLDGTPGLRQLLIGDYKEHELGFQAYVDKDRIAIWGWSFGGFNTLMAMSEGREVFRAGIAIAPPTSWRFYDSVYTERFMRTPKENAEGYDDCPISRASKLHGTLHNSKRFNKLIIIIFCFFNCKQFQYS